MRRHHLSPDAEAFSAPLGRFAVQIACRAMVDALSEAIHKFGPSEIMNTDQGSQFTLFAWTDRLRRSSVRISMDGKGRILDSIFVERLWRSLKYECVYLLAWGMGSEAKTGVKMDRVLQLSAPTLSPWRTITSCDLLDAERTNAA